MGSTFHTLAKECFFLFFTLLPRFARELVGPLLSTELGCGSYMAGVSSKGDLFVFGNRILNAENNVVLSLSLLMSYHANHLTINQ